MTSSSGATTILAMCYTYAYSVYLVYALTGLKMSDETPLKPGLRAKLRGLLRGVAPVDEAEQQRLAKAKEADRANPYPHRLKGI